MSSSSDLLGGTSCSSSSSTGSMDGIGSPVENGPLLSLFTFVASSTHRPTKYQSMSRTTLTDISMDSAYSPSPEPALDYCSCSDDNNCSGRATGDGETLTGFLDSWKFPYLNLIGEDEPRKCHCHLNSRHRGQNYLRHLSRTGGGRLLRSLEKGVLFPLIHWSPKTDRLTPPLHFNQGIYKEWKSVIPPDVWLQNDSYPPDDSALSSPTSSPVPRKPITWLVIGYKSLDKTLDSTLEATWKEWTGTRHVYLHLRPDFEIRRISFLYRIHPIDNLDLFMYVVMIEIGNVHDHNRIWLLDFVQRMRVERMRGFVTVYSELDPEIGSIADQYAKYKNLTQVTGQGQAQPTPPPRTHFHPTLPKTVPPTFHRERPLSQNLLESQTQEINGNIKFMEKLLEEVHHSPIGDYF